MNVNQLLVTNAEISNKNEQTVTLLTGGVTVFRSLSRLTDCAKLKPNEPSEGDGRMNRKEQLTQTHDAILKAASDQFLRRGYAETSTREIARQVGITQPALYHHFSDKEAIFLAVVELVGQQAQTGIMTVNQRVTTGQLQDPVAALAEITEVLLKVHPRDVFSVIHSSFHYLNPANRGRLGQLFSHNYLQPLATFFDQGLVTLQPQLTAQEAASFYLTSLSPLFNNFHHVGPADASHHEQVVLLLRLILFGIAQKK